MTHTFPTPDARRSIDQAFHIAQRRLHAALKPADADHECERLANLRRQILASFRDLEPGSESLADAVDIGRRELIHYADATVSSFARLRARFPHAGI